MAVEVNREALAGLDEIKRSGAVNMVKKSVVTDLALARGFYETYKYLEEVSDSEYMKGVMMGFTAKKKKEEV